MEFPRGQFPGTGTFFITNSLMNTTRLAFQPKAENEVKDQMEKKNVKTKNN